VERRFPALYDARYAAREVSRALWPLLGPLLTALVLIPILALLAGLVALLGLVAPSIHLPSFDPPDLPLPDVTAPDWLRAIGDAIGAVFSVLGPALKYLAIAVAIFFGVRRTQSTRRRRAEAERLGRTELVRRLVVALGAVEAAARERDAGVLGAAVKHGTLSEPGNAPP